MENEPLEIRIASLRPTLFKFTRKFTNDRDESCDLVQDTMLKALSFKSKFRDEVNLKGWLYTIMRNTFINQYRKEVKMKKGKVDSNSHQYFNIEETHTFNKPDNLSEWKEVWAVVDRIKEELSKPFKMYTSGYKYHEIAEHLSLPLGTVKNRIFQARQEIQKHLAGYC